MTQRMTNADFARRVSLITRIGAQYGHELAQGMWNPDFCSADVGAALGFFLKDIEPHMDWLRGAAKAASNGELTQEERR